MTTILVLSVEPAGFVRDAFAGGAGVIDGRRRAGVVTRVGVRFGAGASGSKGIVRRSMPWVAPLAGGEAPAENF